MSSDFFAVLLLFLQVLFSNFVNGQKKNLLRETNHIYIYYDSTELSGKI